MQRKTIDLLQKSGAEPLEIAEISMLIKAINNAQKILDVGVGKGIKLVALALEYPNKSFLGIDIDKSKIKLAQNILSSYGIRNVRLIHSSIENFNNPEKFDSIILSHVLEHLEELYPILRKLRSFLTINGNLCIIVPNKNALFRSEMAFKDLAHRWVFDDESLSFILKRAGFKIKRIIGATHIPFSSRMTKRFSNLTLTKVVTKACLYLGRILPSKNYSLWYICT